MLVHPGSGFKPPPRPPSRAGSSPAPVYTDVMKVLVALSMVLAGSAFAPQDDSHPLIGLVPESVLTVAGHNDEHEMVVSFREDGRRRRTTVEGEYWSLEYELPEAVTRDDIIEHFRDESDRLYGVNHRDAGNRLTFSFSRSDGGETWCQVWATDGNYSLEVVDAGPPDHEPLEEGPEPRASIVFSPGAAFLDDSARDVVTGIVRWLRSQPNDVRAEIRGLRGPGEDLALAERRAGLVAAEIAASGISSERLGVVVDDERRGFAVEVAPMADSP